MQYPWAYPGNTVVCVVEIVNKPTDIIGRPLDPTLFPKPSFMEHVVISGTHTHPFLGWLSLTLKGYPDDAFYDVEFFRPLERLDHEETSSIKEFTPA